MNERGKILCADPYLPFLDTVELPKKVAAAYTDQLWVLRDIASYGSFLIRRCIDEREKIGLVDAVLLMNLAKQAVAMVDGCRILLGESAVLAAHLQARALLEASISFDWIVARDTERRAYAYYVGDLRNQLAWANGVIPRTGEYRRLRDSRAAVEQMNPQSPERIAQVEAEARKQKKRIQNHLRRKRFRPTNMAFVSAKRRRFYDPPWHKVVGAGSVREMAKQVGRVAEYDYFYAVASQVMHGSSYRLHFTVQAGKANMSNIRSPEGIDTLLRIVIALTSKTYRSILGRYRPDEETQYAAKYVRDWRNPFMAIGAPRLEFEECRT